MKKSLVAVLLSLVALTVVAGAAFAEGEFTITANDDEFMATSLAPLSEDITEETDPTTLEYSETDPAIDVTAESKVEFAVASNDEEIEFAVFKVSGSGLQELTGATVEETGDYVLAVTLSEDVYAFEAKVTISGGEPTTPTGDSVNAPSTEVQANMQRFFGKEVRILTIDDVSSRDITSEERSKAISKAIGSTNKMANYVTVLIQIPSDITGKARFAFNAILSNATEGHLLGLVKVKEADLASVEIAVNDDETYFFNETDPEPIYVVPDDKSVNPAVPVKAGDSFVAVITTEEVKGGSPSSGCDMGLLGSLALFAVALLPLRKSR